MAPRSSASRIKLPQRQWFLERGVTIPGYVWRVPPFKFDPPAFAPTSDRLTKRIIETEKMAEHHRRWLESPPDHPLLSFGTYGVGAEPSDQAALYFAAYLVHQWMAKFERRRFFDVRWLAFGSEPDFKLGDEILTGRAKCDLMVLSNLTPNSSQYRLQKARDLLCMPRTFPIITVIAGEDPVSFFATRLHAPLNALFFQTSKSIVRRVTII